MSYRRLLIFSLLLVCLILIGCAPLASKEKDDDDDAGLIEVKVSGVLVVPDNTPRLSSSLRSRVLAGATVQLLNSANRLLSTVTSNSSGHYVFSHIRAGRNYRIHAYLGNIHLYSIVSYVGSSNVDAGQTDSISTAAYLLAQYFVDNGIQSWAQINVTVFQNYLEANNGLVNLVVQTLEAGGNLDTLALVVENAVLAIQNSNLGVRISGELVAKNGALAGATVMLLDTANQLIAVAVSDSQGGYVFSHIETGVNYRVQAYLGNIYLYSVVPHIEDINVDIGQTDSISTAAYLLAQYWVDNGIQNWVQVDMGALQSYLETNSGLVDLVTQALEDGESLDLLASWVETEALNAEQTAVSITASHRVLNTGDEFYIYINVSLVENLYGVAIDLLFDETKIQPKDGNNSEDGIQPVYENGNFFEDGEANLLVNLAEDNQGKLVIGIGKIGAVEGTGGSGNLVKLTFQAIAPVTDTDIYFDDTTSHLVNPSDEEIPLNNWATAHVLLTVH